MSTSISNIEFRDASGATKTLNDYKGKVALLVNVASKCGLTPQYEGLEKIFEKYREQGLMVIGFPANEFAAQEPGTNAEIQEFCKMKFGVQFPVMEKIVVKGGAAHPLYKNLIQAKPKATVPADSKLGEKLKEKGLLSGTEDEIMWNFEKFLINRKGEVVQRFSPDTTPEDPALISAIEKELKG